MFKNVVKKQAGLQNLYKFISGNNLLKVSRVLNGYFCEATKGGSFKRCYFSNSYAGKFAIVNKGKGDLLSKKVVRWGDYRSSNNNWREGFNAGGKAPSGSMDARVFGAMVSLLGFLGLVESEESKDKRLRLEFERSKDKKTHQVVLRRINRVENFLFQHGLLFEGQYLIKCGTVDFGSPLEGLEYFLSPCKHGSFGLYLWQLNGFLKTLSKYCELYENYNIEDEYHLKFIQVIEKATEGFRKAMTEDYLSIFRADEEGRNRIDIDASVKEIAQVLKEKYLGDKNLCYKIMRYAHVRTNFIELLVSMRGFCFKTENAVALKEIDGMLSEVKSSFWWRLFLSEKDEALLRGVEE